MGFISLGALVGRNQSFESPLDPAGLPPGWGLAGFQQASFYPVYQVHSSHQGLGCHVFSTAAPLPEFSYDYSGDELDKVVFQEVSTHAVQTVFWHTASAVDSGDWAANLYGSAGGVASQVLGGEDRMVPWKVSLWTTSHGGSPRFGLQRTGGFTKTTSWGMDNVLTQVDWMTIAQGEGFKRRENRLAQWDRSAQGLLVSGVGELYPAFDVPVQWLTTLQADLINWWWEKGTFLAFTVEPSDMATTAICVIANNTQPVRRRISPYPDKWEAKLELMGVNNWALSF